MGQRIGRIGGFLGREELWKASKTGGRGLRLAGSCVGELEGRNQSLSLEQDAVEI